MRLMKLLAGVFTCTATAAMLVTGCESSEDTRPREDTGVAEEPIDPASCDGYLKPPNARKCRKKAPTAKECAHRDMPDGQGWDDCKLKPRPPTAQLCVEPKDCPAPPKNKDGTPCVQGIFGRLDDGKKYYGCPGYTVINLKDGWTQDVNDLYEDCILYGMLENSCDVPMIFVSKTESIPDYDAAHQDGKGQISAQEFCRAKSCHECKLEARKEGGYTVTECKNFTPKPKPKPKAKDGKMKPTGTSRSGTIAGDPTKTCQIPEYACVPCTACAATPDGSGGAGGSLGAGGYGGFGGAGGYGGYGGAANGPAGVGGYWSSNALVGASKASFISIGGPGSSSASVGSTGGYGASSSSASVGSTGGYSVSSSSASVGSTGGFGGFNGSGGVGGYEADAGVCSSFDEDGDMCGGCDTTEGAEDDGVCQVSEIGPDCECAADPVEEEEEEIDAGVLDATVVEEPMSQ